MDFIGQIELAENGEFQARVRQAVVTAAVQILADRREYATGDRAAWKTGGAGA